MASTDYYTIVYQRETDGEIYLIITEARDLRLRVKEIQEWYGVGDLDYAVISGSVVKGWRKKTLPDNIPPLTNSEPRKHLPGCTSKPDWCICSCAQVT